MKTLSTYRVNPPTTSSGHSISITTTIFGTKEEIEYIKKNCAETIGSGLMQEYGSPLTSQFYLLNQSKVVPADFKAGYKQAILDGKTNYSRPQGEASNG